MTRLFEQNKKIIDISIKAMEAFKRQMDGNASALCVDLTSALNELFSIISDMGLNEIRDEYVAVLGDFLSAQESGDVILLADIIELSLLPFIINLQTAVIGNPEFEMADFSELNYSILGDGHQHKLSGQIKTAEPLEGRDYQAEFTGNGEITIKAGDDGLMKYLCGNYSPSRDARILCDYYIEPDKNKYVIIGAGMLHEAEYLINYRKDFEVWVYEEDAYLFWLALKYRDCSGLLMSERFHIVITSAYEELSGNNGILNESVLIIRKSNLSLMRNNKIRTLFENFYVKAISAKENERLLAGNYNINDRINAAPVDMIKDKLCGKSAAIIAGGPSLNDSISALRDKAEDYYIISVGTVAAKLINNGIVPDAIAITDVKATMLDQITAFCNAFNAGGYGEYPDLLFLSTANSEAVKFYPGQKYIVYQSGYSKAEHRAESINGLLYETGGSVSTTAIDIAIRLGAEKIVCLGLDLAYTNSMSHASGTLEQQDITKLNADRTVKSVSGQTVGTAKNLDIYRSWIENRIKTVKDAKLINVSDGAYIAGMENHPTKDIMNVL